MKNGVKRLKKMHQLNVKNKKYKNFKEANKYRESVDLEIAEKIDIYDQIMNNWEPFILYIWTYFLEADFKRIK